MTTVDGGLGFDRNLVGPLPYNDPDQPNFDVGAQYAANQGFITDVEAAVKNKLQGPRGQPRIVVYDYEAGGPRTGAPTRPRAVEVRYAGAEREAHVGPRDAAPGPAQVKRTYPYVQVQLLELQRATYRQHEGSGAGGAQHLVRYSIGTHSPDATGSLTEVYLDREPIPFDFLFKVQSFARTAQHDREIALCLMMNELLSSQSCYLRVRDTLRQVDVLPGSPRFTMIVTGENQGDKRLFSQIWTFKVTGELYPAGLLITPPPATRIIPTVREI